MTVLTIGEALIDVVVESERYSAHPGGSPLNVAIGLRRLGIDAILHSHFAADAHGKAILRHLSESHVQVTPESLSAHGTSIATAKLDGNGSAHYEFSLNWNPQPLNLDSIAPQLVHTGSIGAWLEPGADAVEEMIHNARPSALISFDPNIRPALLTDRPAAVDKIERFIRMADIVKGSDEDLAWLYPGASMNTVLDRWLDLGPALVIATRGSDGADSLTRQGKLHTQAPSIEVADTIGAGDSFTAGLIAGLHDRNLLSATRRDELRSMTLSTQSQIVDFAAHCAALTSTKAGANPPTRAIVEQFIRDSNVAIG